MSIPKTTIPDGFVSLNGETTVTVVLRKRVAVGDVCGRERKRGGGGRTKSIKSDCIATRGVLTKHTGTQTIHQGFIPQNLRGEQREAQRTAVLTCQRRENGECQANRNVAGEEAELADCFVAVPDCSRESAVADRVDDDQHEEAPRA